MRFGDYKGSVTLADIKRMETHNDKLNMDGLIANHMMKQKTKKDFSVSFHFNNPIKHLPKELFEIEEVKQYLMKNGLDESEAQKYILKKDAFH